MMKFFRKYTKHLLAFFMALLLIVWLGTEPLMEWLRADTNMLKVARGYLGGREIQLAEMQPIFQDKETLDALMPMASQFPWYLVAGAAQVSPYKASEIRSEPLSADEYYILAEEARRKGVPVSDAAVADFKKRYSITPERISDLGKRQRRTPGQVDEAIAAIVRIQESAARMALAIEPSEADIRALMRQVAAKARISLVAFNAHQFANETYQPSLEEIRAQFEKNKDKPRSAGAGQEAGYRMPEEAQIEYIEVSAKELAKRQKISDEEAHEYWKKNQQSFLQPASQPESAPASQPEAPKPYETFTQARAKVLEQMQEEKGKQEAVRIARELISMAAAPWTSAPTTQPGDVRVAPEAQKAATVYPQLIQRLEARYPGALRYGRSGMQDQRAFSMDPQLGRAMYMQGEQQRSSLPQAVFFVPGLKTDPEAMPDETRRLFRGLFETCSEPFVSFGTGNAYVIRTVVVGPERPPEALDLVREDVIRDIRMQLGMEEAERQARELLDQAQKKDLETAFNENADLKERLGETALVKPKPFAHKQLNPYSGLANTNVPEFYGMSDELMNRIFDVKAAATQPSGIFLQEEKDRRQVIVVQRHEILPISREDYEKEYQNVVDHLKSEQRIKFLAEWFDEDKLRERVGWKDTEDGAQARIKAREEREKKEQKNKRTMS